MSAALAFEGFPKIVRLKRDMVVPESADGLVTEKIDGVNGAVVIRDGRVVAAQNRSWFVTPESDKYGFAAWVEANADVLAAKLGDGCHFGEWWGQGIRRHYGMDHKRFSLFNAARWTQQLLDDRDADAIGLGVVPVLHEGVLSRELIDHALVDLRDQGSVAAPGFQNPEGVVIWLTAEQRFFKYTLENDNQSKWAVTPIIAPQVRAA